jgi:hypothetical protein
MGFKMKRILILVSLFTLVQPSAWGQTSDSKQCLSDEIAFGPTAFFRHPSLNPSEKFSGLKAFCEHAQRLTSEETRTADSTALRLPDYQAFFSYPLKPVQMERKIKTISSEKSSENNQSKTSLEFEKAFNTAQLASGKEAREQFLASLNQIRKSQDPVERIIKTYQLVAKTQASFEFDNTLFKYLPGEPIALRSYLIDEESLKSATPRAGVTVQRLFAALLHYGLNTVSTSTTSPKKKDFFVELVLGRSVESTSTPSTWVRLVWANDIAKNGVDKKSVKLKLSGITNSTTKSHMNPPAIDLNSTLFSDFTPLHPSGTQLTEDEISGLKLLLSNCSQALLCFASQTVTSQSHSKNASRSGAR